MSRTKFICVWLLFFTLSFAVSAQNLKLKGSDTLLPLAQRWAQLYQKTNAQVHLALSGGGSGLGIAALLKAETDIAESSRPLNESEKDQFRKLGKTPVDIVVASDAVEILVNPENSVSSLTIEQVKGIFAGTITNWKEIGGSDAKIVLYGRESSSGTHAFVQEHVLHGGPYASDIAEFPSNAPMVAAVSKDKNGICYAGLAAGKSLKSISIAVSAAGSPIAPSIENIHSGKYPLSRSLHWFLLGRPSADVRELCLWVLSTDAQAAAEKLGFIPVSADVRAAGKAKL